LVGSLIRHRSRRLCDANAVVGDKGGAVGFGEREAGRGDGFVGAFAGGELLVEGEAEGEGVRCRGACVKRMGGRARGFGVVVTEGAEELVEKGLRLAFLVALKRADELREGFEPCFSSSCAGSMEKWIAGWAAFGERRVWQPCLLPLGHGLATGRCEPARKMRAKSAC
jgi:hypothetical protein